MALLSTQDASDAGVTLVAAEAGGDTWVAEADVALWAENISGSPITINIPQRKICNHPRAVIGDHDQVRTIQAGETIYVDNEFFAIDDDGLSTVTYSDFASTKVAAVV